MHYRYALGDKIRVRIIRVLKKRPRSAVLQIKVGKNEQRIISQRKNV